MDRSHDGDAANMARKALRVRDTPGGLSGTGKEDHGAPEVPGGMLPYSSHTTHDYTNQGFSAQGTHRYAPTPTTGNLHQLAPLPSMLRYMDNHLMRAEAIFNSPPDKSAKCMLCQYKYDEAPIATTFLPLSPCGHWVHYHCLIWHASRQTSARDKCPQCNIQLFTWEGICALTLVTRTGIDMEDGLLTRAYYDTETNIMCSYNRLEYESDCSFIEQTIQKYYHEEFVQLVARERQLPQGLYPAPKSLIPDGRLHYSTPYGPPIPFTPYPHPADNSPNLCRVFQEVFAELEKQGRPKGVWLKYHTAVGRLLWGTLISIKLKRHAEETSKWVVGTEGWKEFEEARKKVMQNILVEVKGEEPE